MTAGTPEKDEAGRAFHARDLEATQHKLPSDGFEPGSLKLDLGVTRRKESGIT